MKIKLFKLKNFTIIYPLLILLIYLIYYSIQNEKGFISYFNLNYQVKKIQKDLKILENEEKKLKNNISHLNPKSLCLTLLDEQVRKTINLVHMDDAVILLKE